MKISLILVVQLLSFISFTIATSSAFLTNHQLSRQKSNKNNNPTTPLANMAASVPGPETNMCDLPGDRSLILTTNVDLGDKKMEIMKACSKAIEKATGKPESYIGK